MRYLIDLTSLNPNNTGIEYVAENAALSFIKANKNSRFILVFNDFVPEKFIEFKSLETFEIVQLNENNWNHLRCVRLPKIIRKYDADLNLFFAFPCPYFAPHNKSVSLIHDLTPWKFPKTQTFFQNLKWKKMIKKCIKKDKHLLTVSDTVKYEIANKFCRGDAKRIYPGIKNPINSSDVSILKNNNLESKKYILSVGTFEPRKNFESLIQAFTQLKSQKQIDEKLVIVGKSGWKTNFKIDDKDIVLLDYQNDENLSVLYKNAKLFVSPSIYEGFGLPVIEAVKHDLKILVSDAPIYRETTKNNAMYFDFNNIDDLINKIKICLNDDCCQQNIEHKNFNWDYYGKELSKFLTSNNKYLCLCTSNLQNDSGYKRRVQQYYWGLENNHYVDKYVGNSNVNFSVMSFVDIFRALVNKNCAIKHKDFVCVKKLLRSGCYSTVFIDNSLYGNIYKKLRTNFPDIKIITHFHNCEYKYYSDLCSYHNKTSLNLMSKLSIWMIRKSESFAINYSDKVIFITEEDKKQVLSESSKNTKSYVIPACILDSYIEPVTCDDDNKYVLFVGSNFYANIEAIDFLIDKVSYHINKKIVILGDDLINKYENTNNVILKSYKDNVYDAFSKASAFVSPVFSGSGSKIKIAEALMWGKKLIASKESLFGYDYKNLDLTICQCPQDFTEAINSCNNEGLFSKVNRDVYLKYHSLEANNQYFKDI